MGVVVFGILGGVGWWIYQTVQNSEEVRFAQAKDDLKYGRYGNAESTFRELLQRFPASEHAKEYSFLQELCILCGGLINPETNLAEDADKCDAFIKSHKENLLKFQRADDVGQRVHKLAGEFAERYASPSDDKPLAAAQRIETLRGTVETLPDALSKEEAAQIDANLAKVRVAVARWRERQEVLDKLHVGPREGPIDAIKRARVLLQQKDRESPGFSQDAAIKAALGRLYEAHLASVVYQPRGRVPHGPTREEDEVEKPASSLRCCAWPRPARLPRTTGLCWLWLAASSMRSNKATAKWRGRRASASTRRSCRSVCRRLRQPAPNACWCCRPTRKR